MLLNNALTALDQTRKADGPLTVIQGRYGYVRTQVAAIETKKGEKYRVLAHVDGNWREGICRSRKTVEAIFVNWGIVGVATAGVWKVI